MLQVTKADIVRRIVTTHAAQPDGFHYGLTEAAGIMQTDAARVCRLLIRDGLAFRVKVKGQRTRLHSTAKASKAWADRQPAIPRPGGVKMGVAAQAVTDRATLLMLAGRPQGVALADCPAHVSNVTWRRRTGEMMADGALHVDDVRKPFLYFTTPEAAEASKEATALLVAVSQEQTLAGRKARQRVYDAAQRLARAPVVKPAKPEKFVRRQAQAIERKPYTPPAARVPPVIVWPARMPECRMMGLGRYEASVPRLSIGQPGWSMSI